MAKSVKMAVAQALAQTAVQAVREATSAMTEMTTAIVEAAGSLRRIEALLDEQADLVADRTDKIEPVLKAVKAKAHPRAGGDSPRMKG